MLRNVAQVMKMQVKSLTQTSSGRFKGKTAIVTASTEGIGLSVARRLALEGASVVISSRNEKKLKNALEELSKQNIDISGVVCHVAKEEHRQKLVEHTINKYGKIDILVSNAGTNPVMGPIMETDLDAWETIMRVNLTSSFLMAKDVYPHLKRQGGGSILFMSSITGYQAMPQIGVYSISKTALIGLSRALAMELAPENIRVNCIAPGIIKTKFSAALTADEEAISAVVPYGRLGTTEDIAGTAAFLLSKDADYITGECIVAAGGMFSRL